MSMVFCAVAASKPGATTLRTSQGASANTSALSSSASEKMKLMRWLDKRQALSCWCFASKPLKMGMKACVSAPPEMRITINSGMRLAAT